MACAVSAVRSAAVTSSASERAALRIALRRSREADRQPGSICALLGYPPRRYDLRSECVKRVPQSRWAFVDDAIMEASGGCTEFAMPRATASRAARRHFQRARAMHLPYCEEAEEFARRLEGAQSTARELFRLQSTEASKLRKLAGNGQEHTESELGEPTEDTAEETTVAQPLCLNSHFPGFSKVASVGDLLLTHPIACISQPIFDRAAVLLFEVGGRDNNTVSGVVLNKPSKGPLQQLLEKWPDEQDRSWASKLELGSLLDMPFFQGGPVVADSLQDGLRWLHAYGAELPGAVEVAPGLWLGGGLAEVLARAHVQGDKEPKIKLFYGISTWSLPQLANELECGVWARASLSPAVQSSIGASTASDSGAQRFRDFCLEMQDTGPSRGLDAWRLATCSAGLSDLAAFPRGVLADRWLLRLMEAHARERSDE